MEQLLCKEEKILPTSYMLMRRISVKYLIKKLESVAVAEGDAVKVPFSAYEAVIAFNISICYCSIVTSAA